MVNKVIVEEDQLYIIQMEISKDTERTIGKLGNFVFPKGTYLYIGSAKRNIQARITRHLTKDKKMRWHLDYLRPLAQVSAVMTFPLKMGECALKRFIEASCSGKVIVEGFGASDCRCNSHLLKLPSSMSMKEFHKLKKRWMVIEGKR